MNIEVILIALATGALCLVFGWSLGARVKASGLAAARAEGRAESSVELARLQERLAFVDASSQEQRDRLSGFESELQLAQERATRAETESTQLRERLTAMAGNFSITRGRG